MTTKKIYGPWIEWHGGECPVPPDTMVEVRFRGGGQDTASPADGYYWKHDRDAVDIVEYRTVTEEPDLDAAEKLLRENGYTIIPPAKPLTFEDVVPMTEPPPAGRTITLIVNDREWVLPKPFRNEPEKGATYWTDAPGGVFKYVWQGDVIDKTNFRDQRVHASESDAQAWADFNKWCRGGGV